VSLDCVIYCAFYSILFGRGGRFFPDTVYNVFNYCQFGSTCRNNVNYVLQCTKVAGRLQAKRDSLAEFWNPPIPLPTISLHDVLQCQVTAGRIYYGQKTHIRINTQTNARNFKFI